MRGNTLLVSPKMRLHFVGESAGTPLFAAGPALVSSKLPDQDLFGFLSVGSWPGVAWSFWGLCQEGAGARLAGKTL